MSGEWPRHRLCFQEGWDRRSCQSLQFCKGAQNKAGFYQANGNVDVRSGTCWNLCLALNPISGMEKL